MVRWSFLTILIKSWEFEVRGFVQYGRSGRSGGGWGGGDGGVKWWMAKGRRRKEEKEKKRGK